LECIVSEAEGTALKHATSGLAHHQAVKQLSSLFGCDPSWEAIKRYRKEVGFDKYTEKLFEASGIECILMDDLLAASDKVTIPYTWHDRLTKSKTRRIVRVESLAEQVAKRMKEANIREFLQNYLRLVVDSAKDPEVVGFKSVICYRSGLDIQDTRKAKMEDMQETLIEYMQDAAEAGSWRLNSKPLNDLVANLAIQVSGDYKKPIQFHTGLGDNSLRLVKANPAYMQNIIEAYPKTKIVLLHSSYPFTREAGYLVTVYDNVYLDCTAISSL
jgi:hypothetical protein